MKMIISQRVLTRSNKINWNKWANCIICQ